ncbi:VanW like protein [Thermosyntropha lipolytica DSM 11003]|uniref:VanW like protein n=1 Tax=Thermosyntropha lipolytica DSM 11003 TaxID=1123382 RepID=A0A1M5KUX5_9FIRM|nr:VanW like protein [Thermosyntropha lipolytica DSM 11003]
MKPGVEVAGEKVEGLLPEEVQEVVEELAVRYQKVPIEPTIDKITGEIIPEKYGVIIDVESTVNEVLRAGENEKISLKVIKIKPRYSADDLQRADTVIGSYCTFIAGSYARFNNISLASKAINNTVVWPGEIFSFNNTVGPRTPERGYMPAPVIMMGAMDFDYGGGVCQVASTLYNAALKAGLKIIERHMHSRRIHYVPEGMDATVDYGSLDLRFENNTAGPVIIKSAVKGGKLVVEIWGER